MTDYLLSLWVSGLTELSKAGWMIGRGEPWRPGDRLRLLFAGYNGARNTGADVRVEEMLRQIRRVLGPENVELSVLTQDKKLTEGYFDSTRQVLLPDIFPGFLYRNIPEYEGVVACEGSMFKSKFANALTVMMVGSLGMASARNRLSVGYGAEAGRMDGFVRRMCSRYCDRSFIITRNEESREVLSDLGIATEIGTDTAWTFEPHGPEYGTAELKRQGWDGQTPVLVICPINPFWWPVKASMFKAIATTLTGAYKKSRFRNVYYFNAGPDVDAAYDRYLSAIANAVTAFRQRHDVFPITVAMEQLDTDACRRLSDRLGGAPILPSSDYDMYQLVSILRSCHMMVSSRYHGIVTSMPGLVPSAGITMDERIRNLMHERGHQHLLMTVDDPDLETKLITVLEQLHAEGDAIRDGIAASVVSNLKIMSRMGAFFIEHVKNRFPEFPVEDGLRCWRDFLPQMSPSLENLVDANGG